MKLTIDGTEYEIDSDFFVDAWYRATLPYVDPSQEPAKKYGDIRLAAKGLLRLYLKSVLKTFALIFHIDDYRQLEPKRGEDVLVKLHGYLALLMRAEGQHLTLEMETEEPHDSARLLGDGALPRLALTRAAFDGGQEIYRAIQRPDTGREVGDDSRSQFAALGPGPSGGRLVSDADTPEI